MSKIIFHVDINSFYASAEVAKDPTLKNQPLVVSGSSRRGIVLTASYPARKFGIHAAMPLFQAEKLCPQIVVRPPNFELYQEYSKYFFDVLKMSCDAFEAASIDEAYLDVTNTVKIYDNPIDLAVHIQKTLLEKYQLPVSIGIAPNRFLAKMASDLKKPLGITVLRKRDVKNILWPLPIEDFFGIGKMTYPRLKNIGVNKIGDLLDPNKQKLLKAILGNSYESVIRKAMGEGSTQIDSSNHELQQIGNSRTFSKDTADPDEIKHKLSFLIETVHERMVKRNMVSKTFTVSFKYELKSSVSRSHTFEEAHDRLDLMERVGQDLFDRHWNGQSIRLIGFSTGEVLPKKSVTKQLDLFHFQNEEEKSEAEKIFDQLQGKYGEEIIKKASD